MASVAKIVFDANPATNYVITYRKSIDNTWITPPGNPTNVSPFYIAGLEDNTTYDFKIESDCGITTVTETTSGSVTYVWVEDTFTCEQDSPFALIDTYTGFSSPQGIYWDQTSGRYYVVDVDDVNGNVWWFNPDTITGYADANHVTGTNSPVNMLVTAHAYDSVNRKIWTAGDDTGGARVLDLASGTWTFLPYGSDGSGGSSQRSPLLLSNTTAYCFSLSPNTIETFDLVTLAPIDSILKSSIPSSSTYFTQSYGVTFVGAEAWVHAGSRSNGNIAIYNSDFSSIITTIDLVAAGCQTPGAPWTPNPSLFWQSHFYDSTTNRWYVSDTGSSRVIIIDTVTRAIINNIVIGNKRGKLFAAASFFKSQLTGELFVVCKCENDASDGTANFKLYKLTDAGITYVYPDESTTNLTLRSGTNESWGVQQNLVQWQGGSWNTDGLVFKYNEA